MDELTPQITVGRAGPKDIKTILDGMLLHHAKSGHQRTSEVINIFLKDNYKKVKAGAVVTVLWNGVDINMLWVEESLRKKGIGKKLMEMIEEQAKLRGCNLIYTNTFSWQGPEFYEKLGFIKYGELKDFPEGETLSYYAKTI
jgi:GNAT superfamily N-acetyltransferase